VEIHLEEQSGERARALLRGECEIDAGTGPISLHAELRDGSLWIEREGAAAARVGARPFEGGVCIREGDRTTVWREAQPHRVRQASGAEGAGSAGELRAPFPAVVREVRAVPGQHVAEGDVLAVIEAMKMMHNLAATGAGVVAEVRCREGETVEGGQVLVVFSSESAGG